MAVGFHAIVALPFGNRPTWLAAARRGAAVASIVPGSARGQQDAAAVRAEVERHYAAIRAGDLETVIAQHTRDFTIVASRAPSRPTDLTVP